MFLMDDRSKLQAEINALETRTKSELDAHARKLDMRSTDLDKREDALCENQRALEEMERGLKQASTSLMDKTQRESETLKEVEVNLQKQSRCLQDVGVSFR